MASSAGARGWNQITLPVLLMISGPLTLPPPGAMKMSPLPLPAPCCSTVTAGASARVDAPEVTVLQAVPVKTMSAAAAAVATARGALPRRELAARHETALSLIATLSPSGSHYLDRPLPPHCRHILSCLPCPVFLADAKSQGSGRRVQGSAARLCRTFGGSRSCLCVTIGHD